MLFLLTAAVAIEARPESAPHTLMAVPSGNGLGTIKGVVRDESGGPIADATVAIFRVGTSKLLKQVSTLNDGSFLAKVMPGTYSVLAVAQGFNPFTLATVEVNRSAEFVYGFKLERAGSGNTLPEKRLDRNSSKWRIRAAQNQRSIYQNTEGDMPVSAESDDASDKGSRPKPQAVVESYFASGQAGNFAGLNFAALLPIDRRARLTFAGQVAKGRSAPQRFEAGFDFAAGDLHDLKVKTSVGRYGSRNSERPLTQFSLQAVDEWKIREGVILVLGFDYSKFAGAGNDSALSPRVGVQFDIDTKTRARAAFTTQTEERNWSDVIELEGFDVAFAEPVAVEDLVVENGKAKMNRSGRLEFGVERILDGRSSIEANVFTDTTFAKGVGLNFAPLGGLAGDEISDIVAEQQGRSTGLRVVYSRRLNGILNASAGYAIGLGQALSASAISDPANSFRTKLFQTLFGQIDADFDTGTSVRAILRLSPKATVFAIDPFKGRLAIYDPGMSVFITQRLPRLGLPLRAQAVLDARNIFDFQRGLTGSEGIIRIDGQRRMLRGGIMVRF